MAALDAWTTKYVSGTLTVRASFKTPWGAVAGGPTLICPAGLVGECVVQ